MKYAFYVTSPYEALFFTKLAGLIGKVRECSAFFVGKGLDRYRTIYERRGIKVLVLKSLSEFVEHLEDELTIFYRFPYKVLLTLKDILGTIKLVRCVYGYSKYTGIPRWNYTYSPVVNEAADAVLVTGRYPFLKMSLVKKAVDGGCFYLDPPWRDKWYPMVRKPRKLFVMLTWDEFKEEIGELAERLKRFRSMKVYFKLHHMEDERVAEKLKKMGFGVVSSDTPLSVVYKSGDAFICDDTGAKFEALLFGKPTFILSKRRFLPGSLESFFIEKGFIIPISMEDVHEPRIFELVGLWGSIAWNSVKVFRKFIKEIYDYSRNTGVVEALEGKGESYQGPWDSPIFGELKTMGKFLVLYYEIERSWSSLSLPSLVINGLPFRVDVVPMEGSLKGDRYGSFVGESIVNESVLSNLDEYMGVGFFFNVSVLPDGWMWSVREFLRSYRSKVGFSPLGALYVVERDFFKRIVNSVNIKDAVSVARFLSKCDNKVPVFFWEKPVGGRRCMRV